MTASDAFRSGRLAEATTLQLAAVKADPADHGKRLFLFELAAFAGDRDRARRQIDAVQYDDPDLVRLTNQYKLLLDAEVARDRLFRDGLQPSFLADPPEHFAYRLDAIKKLREGDAAAAASLVAEANAMLPPLAGTLNDKPFEGLRDADDLFAGILEVMALGRYLWVALEQVDTLASVPPKSPRDTIWLPVRLNTHVGESGEVFVPTRYPASSAHADDAVKLGRATDWSEAAPGVVRGAGAKIYLVGDADVPLVDMRELQSAPA